MDTLTEEAIEGYKRNKFIMDFITKEAYKKVACEFRDIYGGNITEMNIEAMIPKCKDVAARVNEYIELGLIGCYMDSVERGVQKQ